MMFLIHVRPDASPWSAWFTDRGPAIALGIVVSAYATGARRIWGAAGVARGITRRHVWCFTAAVLVLVLALLSPLDALSDDLFAAHMMQHLLLAVIVPPLLVLAAPELALFWSLPFAARRRAGRALRRLPGARVIWRGLTVPIVACSLHASAFWIWHSPRLYELALRSDAAHAAEHLSFVGTGVLLWWRIVHPPRERRGAYGVGIITLFATTMQAGILGALITLSHRVLYPSQGFDAARWGLDPLADQQLAGLLMWVAGGLLYVIAMSALFVAWLSPESRRRARIRAVAGGVVTTIACGRRSVGVSTDGNAQRGKQTIAAMGCGACHVIDGVAGAHGEVGPPLDGVARRAIIGGTLPNTRENMMLWIEDPPSIAPNTAMPNLGVTPQSARDIVAYLYTLK